MITNFENYQPPQKERWIGRKDSLPGERFFQTIQCIDIQKMGLTRSSEKAFGIIGFCSDVGIQRNLGRPGAASGPDALRHALGKLASHRNEFQLYDVGNVLVLGDDLEQAQTALSEIIHYLIQNKIHPIVLGGGHETAWGHYQGLVKNNSQLDLGIINFDAHFDLRPLSNSKGNSGTPFRQIALDCQKRKKEFAYYCLGIQPAANTKSLFDYANELKVNYFLAEDLYQKPTSLFIEAITKFCEKHDSIYLSLCLDVFADWVAPGVSAPQPFGLTPWQIIPLLRYLAQSKKVLSLDVVELSPPLDQNNRTAALAAGLISAFIEHFD